MKSIYVAGCKRSRVVLISGVTEKRHKALKVNIGRDAKFADIKISDWLLPGTVEKLVFWNLYSDFSFSHHNLSPGKYFILIWVSLKYINKRM